MKNKLTVGGVALALVLSVLTFINQPTDTVVERTVERVGAIPGSSVNTPDFTVNGVTGQFASVSFSQGTSTLCVIPRPAATSTLLSFTAKNTSATSSSILYVLEKRTAAFAPVLAAATSTSVIGSVILSANDDEMVATGTPFTAGDDKDVFEVTPSQFLVLFAKNGGGGTINQGGTGSVFTGQCNAELQEVQ